MTTDNIFGNDVLNGDLTTSLVPELGQENILIDVTPSETSLIDPLAQELSLTEQEPAIDEIDIDTSGNNDSSFNNIPVANTDPLIAANAEEFQVNGIDVNDTSFAPPQSELEFQGGFGDFDGGNDVTLEIEDTEGNVVETFKLTGEGQASLYRDEDYQYIFFSGVDETTNVDIDSVSNIKFGDYIGDSLEIKTSGSIEGGDIILSEPDETGLVLKSGLDVSNDSDSLSYSVVNLGVLPGEEKSIAVDINNSGEIVGYSSSEEGGWFSRSGTTEWVNNPQKAFLFKDGEMLDVLPDVNSSKANSINESGQIVGYTGDIYNSKAFSYSNGNLEYLDSFPDSAENIAYAINDLGQIVGNSSKGSNAI